MYLNWTWEVLWTCILYLSITKFMSLTEKPWFSSSILCLPEQHAHCDRCYCVTKNKTGIPCPWKKPIFYHTLVDIVLPSFCIISSKSLLNCPRAYVAHTVSKTTSHEFRLSPFIAMAVMAIFSRVWQIYFIKSALHIWIEYQYH